MKIQYISGYLTSKIYHTMYRVRYPVQKSVKLFCKVSLLLKFLMEKLQYVSNKMAHCDSIRKECDMLRYVYYESLLKYIKVTPRKYKTENGNFCSCDTTATHFKHEHNVTLGHSYDVSTSENLHLSPWFLAFNNNYLHQHVLYNLNVNWAGLICGEAT